MAVHTHGVTRAGGWKDQSSTIIPPPQLLLPLLNYWSDLILYVAHDYPMTPNILVIKLVPPHFIFIPAPFSLFWRGIPGTSLLDMLFNREDLN